MLQFFYAILLLALTAAHAMPAQAQERPGQATRTLRTAQADEAHVPEADGDERWDNRFGKQGLSGEVYAVALAPNGDLYVGGWFTQAGGADMQGIARWDGRQWHALGQSITAGYYATDLAVAPNGELYAVGNFTEIDGKPANYVARWDGEQWHALGEGVGYTAYAVAVIGGDVYVGGAFRQAGGRDIVGLARWNIATQTWSPVGGGLSQSSYQPEVHTLTAHGTDLYVGGRFTGVSNGADHSLEAYDIARWDGAAWHALGRGLGNDGGGGYFWDRTVAAIVVEDDGDVVAGGEFTHASNIEDGTFTNVLVNGLARWDGTQWRGYGTGARNGSYSASVKALLADGDRLYAGGIFSGMGDQQARSLALWENGEWHEVGGGFADDYATVNALARDADGSLVVGGNIGTLENGMTLNELGRWDGANWRVYGDGLWAYTEPGEIEALAVAHGLVLAGGDLFEASGRKVERGAAWNGTEWTYAPFESLDGAVDAFAVAPNGDVYAGGWFTTIGGITANRIARWDGTTWHALGTGVDGNVKAIAVAPNGDVYVGGYFDHAGAVQASRVARWDGAQWHALGEGLQYVDPIQFPGETRVVRAIDVADDGDVYVGGEFFRVDGILASRIARWDGAQWHALGDGLSGGAATGPGAFAIEVVGPDVYVGGEFDVAGTVTAPGLAVWNAAAGWAAVGAGLGGGAQKVSAFARNGNLLYVGGHFEQAGNLASSNIALWDLNTRTWSALGSGLRHRDELFGLWPDGVRDLALDGNDLWAGGNIVAAGGKTSFGIAYWVGDAPDAVAQATIAVDPLQVQFGDVAVGRTEVLLVTVANAADAATRLSGAVTVSGTPFSLDAGGGAFSLAPGESREVIVRFSPQVAGAAAGTLTVTHDAGNAGSPVTVRLDGTGTGNANVMALRNFDPDGPQLFIGAQGGGAVFGTNVFGDRAKATVLNVPLGKTGATRVTEVKVWYAYRSAAPGTSTYTVMLQEGAAETGPAGAVLFSQRYDVADVNADDDPETPEGPTVYTLPEPVEVSGSFFIIVDFGTYTDSNLLALAAGSDADVRVPEVWEMSADGTWQVVSDAWEGLGGYQLWAEATATTGTSTADEQAENLPSVYALHAGYPNPFSEQATIEYDLPHASHVTVRVYDVVGREVAVLVDDVRPAGRQEAAFDGRHLASGLYLVQMAAEGFAQTQRLMLVR